MIKGLPLLSGVFPPFSKYSTFSERTHCSLNSIVTSGVARCSGDVLGLATLLWQAQLRCVLWKRRRKWKSSLQEGKEQQLTRIDAFKNMNPLIYALSFRKAVLAVDLGGTKCSAALVDPLTGEFLVETITRSHSGYDFLEVLQTVANMVKQQQPANCQITSAAIGCAGLVDAENGILLASNNLKVKDFALADAVSMQLALPCYLANDVEAAALGELKFGAGRESSDFIVVFVGTGVGARMVQDGQIRRGACGTAGELGQVLVRTGFEDSRASSLKQLEYYCSRPGISRLIRQRTASNAQPELSYAQIRQMLAADAGLERRVVSSALADSAELLGIELANLVNFVNPEMIVLGGGVIEQLDGYLERVEQSIRRHALELPARALRVRRACLGDNAGVLGAALLPSYHAFSSRKS